MFTWLLLSKNIEHELLRFRFLCLVLHECSLVAHPIHVYLHLSFFFISQCCWQCMDGIQVCPGKSMYGIIMLDEPIQRIFLEHGSSRVFKLRIISLWWTTCKMSTKCIPHAKYCIVHLLVVLKCSHASCYVYNVHRKVWRVGLQNGCALCAVFVRLPWVA
jgi:hypothetical protein